MRDLTIRPIVNGYILKVEPYGGEPQETACRGIAELLRTIYNKIGPVKEESWETFVKNHLNSNEENPE